MLKLRCHRSVYWCYNLARDASADGSKSSSTNFTYFLKSSSSKFFGFIHFKTYSIQLGSSKASWNVDPTCLEPNFTSLVWSSAAVTVSKSTFVGTMFFKNAKERMKLAIKMFDCCTSNHYTSRHSQNMCSSAFELQ